MFRRLTRYLHSLTRRHSPDTFALAMARSHRELDFQRECWANDTAANLRAMGHDCPAGTVLAGITVTR